MKKKYKIVQIPGKPGFQRIDGYIGNSHVFSLSDGIRYGDNHKWIVSMSTALPTDIAKAKIYLDCYNECMKILEESEK